MKSAKYLFITLIALVLGFASCTKSNYEPGPLVGGEQVCFAATNTTNIVLEPADTSFEVALNRVNTIGDLSVNILAIQQPKLFNVPSTVFFADGVDAASVKVTFDTAELEDGVDYSLSLMIDGEEGEVTTPYGASVLELKIAKNSWTVLGEGLFRDDFIAGFWSLNPAEAKVVISEHVSQKGVYKLTNAFVDVLQAEFGGTLAQIESKGYIKYYPTDLVINASNPDSVVIEDQATGCFDLEEGYGMYNIGTLTPGTLKDGIITFPVQGLFLQCEAGKAYANKSGMFRVILPGVEPKDYSIEMEYVGMQVPPKGADYAQVSFLGGANVEEIRYVVAEGDVTADPSAQIESIVSGASDVKVVAASEFAEAPAVKTIEGLVKGKFTVVALPVENGVCVDSQVATLVFNYPGLGGGPAAELSIDLAVLTVTEYVGEPYPAYPDTTCLVTVIENPTDEVESFTWGLFKTSAVESHLQNPDELKAILEEYGSAADADDVKGLNGVDGYDPCEWVFSKLNPDTNYTLLVHAVSISGAEFLGFAQGSTLAEEEGEETEAFKAWYGTYNVVIAGVEYPAVVSKKVAGKSLYLNLDEYVQDFIVTMDYDAENNKCLISQQTLGQWSHTQYGTVTDTVYGFISYNGGYPMITGTGYPICYVNKDGDNLSMPEGEIISITGLGDMQLAGFSMFGVTSAGNLRYTDVEEFPFFPLSFVKKADPESVSVKAVSAHKNAKKLKGSKKINMLKGFSSVVR